MSRTLSEQLGFKPDPHAPEHITHGGQKLTRVYTKGGHELDSQQKGLPVYHRRIANPYPVFAIGIGASLLTLGLVFVEARGLQNPQILLNIGLPLGGIGVMTAAMFSFAEGNTFLATAAGTLAGLVGGISLVFLPWTGIQQAYLEEANGDVVMGLAELNKAVAFLFFGAMIPVFGLLLASFKTAIPLSISALLIVIALIIQGTAYLNPMVSLTKTAGALFIIVGILLFYSATAVLLQEEGVKILPVLPLPRME
ncbi:hypothetical protein FA10DRAFT_235938 [Acaromyces ingoldii]|uniref:Uncharacterized protein n=1 Tax=Acaromyces ingoldii TaxID=215250 RepID=A0A316YUK0_9BASI|nr:hypothetical protein FA10DRAFT_235938 [Acaromyces ingoldii]PWN92782.1 hypothetical protein FA10DRAFT_235938 [Acaromyces ingoldii]